MSLYFLSQLNIDAEPESVVARSMTNIQKNSKSTGQEIASARYLSYVVFVQAA